MIKKCFVQGSVDDNRVFITSGFQPPTDADLITRNKISAYMQSYASGGSIDHIFLGGKITCDMKKNLINKMFSTPMTYITLSPIVSLCQSCGHKSVGENYTCPECGDSEHMMVYGRVIGYVRPIVSGRVKIENNSIEGDENYWQDSRRVDWVERNKL